MRVTDVRRSTCQLVDRNPKGRVPRFKFNSINFFSQVSPYQSPYVRLSEQVEKLGDLVELKSTLEVYQSSVLLQDIVHAVGNYYPSFNVLCEATIYHTYNKNAGKIVYIGEPPSSTLLPLDWNDPTYNGIVGASNGINLNGGVAGVSNRKPAPDAGSALKSEAASHLLVATKYFSQLLIFFSLMSVSVISL